MSHKDLKETKRHQPDPDIVRCDICNSKTREWRMTTCRACGKRMCHGCAMKHWHNDDDYPTR